MVIYNLLFLDTYSRMLRFLALVLNILFSLNAIVEHWYLSTLSDILALAAKC